MIIFSNKCGQLGNRLFCFAHLIANAAAHNHLIVNLSFDEYARYFENTSKDVLCRFPIVRSKFNSDKLRTFLFLINKAIWKTLRMMRLNSSGLHEVVIADLPEYQFKENRSFDLNAPALQEMLHLKSFVFLFGRFFRDYSNVEKYQDIIREYFRPVKAIEQVVGALIAKARNNINLVVGVHIRRGDYQQFSDGKYYYSQQQYACKMEELVKEYPKNKIAFVICSNEKIDHRNFHNLIVIEGSGHLVEDMYALSACDLIMGPPSTFTLWASFYGNVPLYQMKDLIDHIYLDNFKVLPPEILYNFSFN